MGICKRIRQYTKIEKWKKVQIVSILKPVLPFNIHHYKQWQNIIILQVKMLNVLDINNKGFALSMRFSGY